jgi:hypothetical protein
MFVRRRWDELERELRARILLLERCVDDSGVRERAIHLALARERERSIAADKRADLAQNNFEWARVRLNQVEQERATLIATLLKTPIAALELERQHIPEQGSGLPHLSDALFDDVGDDVARTLGLTHDEVTHG